MAAGTARVSAAKVKEYQTLAQNGVGKRNAASATHKSTITTIKRRIDNRKRRTAHILSLDGNLLERRSPA
jgi:hypothetical protein